MTENLTEAYKCNDINQNKTAVYAEQLNAKFYQIKSGKRSVKTKDKPAVS